MCSEELNKCYIIVNLSKIKYVNPNLTEISWDNFNDIVCRQHGWTMISVHSRIEQEFIRVGTKYVINIELAISHPDGYNGYAYLGNILLFLYSQYSISYMFCAINVIYSGINLILEIRSTFAKVIVNAL